MPNNKQQSRRGGLWCDAYIIMCASIIRVSRRIGPSRILFCWHFHPLPPSIRRPRHFIHARPNLIRIIITITQYTSTCAYNTYYIATNDIVYYVPVRCIYIYINCSEHLHMTLNGWKKSKSVWKIEYRFGWHRYVANYRGVIVVVIIIADDEDGKHKK